MAKFLRIEYTGKLKDTGEVFDTTQKSDAEKAGLGAEGRNFGAVPMILGEKSLIKGFESALETMKVGEEKTIVIEPKDAYGERNPDLVKIVPMNVFKNAQQKPYPGMVVVFEKGLSGKVQSVSGGRVRIDFNHELAGKTLEFWIKILEEINSDDAKVKALYELSFPGANLGKLKVDVKDKEVVLGVQKELSALRDLQQRKLALTESIKKYLKVEKVVFNEEF